MKRRLFNLLAAVSLVLCAATVVEWVRNAFVGDTIQFVRSGARDNAVRRQALFLRMNFTDRGTTFNYMRFTPSDRSNRRETPQTEVNHFVVLDNRSSLSRQAPWYTLGFWARKQRNVTFYADDFIWDLVIPYWAWLISFGTLPALWLLRNRRAQVTRGLCRRCGYDLRASKDRCPECGMAIPAAAAETK